MRILTVVLTTALLVAGVSCQPSGTMIKDKSAGSARGVKDNIDQGQPSATQPAIKTISHGEAIQIKEHLVQGKITIFDYYADWCVPCRVLTPKLERLLLRYEGVILRKVDIVNWESAAAKQASRDFRLPGLPFTRIIDDKGNLLGQIQGNFIEKIEAIIREHAKPTRGNRE